METISKSDAPDTASLAETDDSSNASITNSIESSDLQEIESINLQENRDQIVQQSEPSSLNTSTTVTRLLKNVVAQGMGYMSNESTSMTVTVMGLFGSGSYKHAEEKKALLSRRRLHTMPLDKMSLDDVKPEDEAALLGEHDKAYFVAGHGLVDNWFWHAYQDNCEGTIHEERAILFQAVEHYDAISQDPTFGKYMQGECPFILPTFGEQVLVKGCDASKLAVGDVFVVEGELSSLVVEITAPRVPSYHINLRHGTPKGLKGMKRHVLTHALGGWFARVVIPGELRDGMRLVRNKHPNPKYTLTYLTKVLYSEGNSVQLARGLPHWERSKKELRDLSVIPQLANFEWRNEATKLLNKMEETEQHHFLSVVKYNLRFLPMLFSHQAPTLTVMGLFGRRGHYVEDEDQPVNKDRALGKMCRRRLKTRPLNHATTRSTISTTTTYTTPTQITKEIDTDEYETAMFVPGRGLLGNRMYHHYVRGAVLEERAILFQSVESYNTISENSTYGKYLKNENIMTEPTFGEQVIVQGCNTSELSVGDVFIVEGGLSELEVEITSPRLPCFHVDDRHRSPRGLQGLKRYAMTNALAGWFTRVRKGGELRDGMKLIRTHHPHPKYTLTYLSKVLYSEGSRKDMARCKSHWVRSRDELVKLIDLPQLGRHEWKEEAEDVLAAMDGKKKKRRRNNVH